MSNPPGLKQFDFSCSGKSGLTNASDACLPRLNVPTERYLLLGFEKSAYPDFQQVTTGRVVMAGFQHFVVGI